MRATPALRQVLRGQSRLFPRTSASSILSRSAPQSPSPLLSTSLFRSRQTAVPSISRSFASSEEPKTRDPRPLTDSTASEATDAENAEQNRARRAQEPMYQITFTCKPCGDRSSHQMSKHGYHRGTVLIRCPTCSNRHVISDHLGIFLDNKSTLEDILERDGRKLKKGYLNGDMEFWDDGTSNPKQNEEQSGKAGEQ
ncbi:mitochondrial import protein Zim17 [Paecilomyces variotii No. 5]|uniref:Mitochondrial import protein Zim17 n=1 Tax=Byssochlamys spectabilis (strain No. 5 / NBRC 109023) TaxID=1356009 RepID=V5FYG7_BYSSN|nr:mitochondrial import protein Zim17 [Paecilomyces variotii No. 5]